VLCEAGAELTSRNRDGELAADAALKNGHIDLSERLAVDHSPASPQAGPPQSAFRVLSLQDLSRSTGPLGRNDVQHMLRTVRYENELVRGCKLRQWRRLLRGTIILFSPSAACPDGALSVSALRSITRVAQHLATGEAGPTYVWIRGLCSDASASTITSIPRYIWDSDVVVVLLKGSVKDPDLWSEYTCARYCRLELLAITAARRFLARYGRGPGGRIASRGRALGVDRHGRVAVSFPQVAAATRPVSVEDGAAGEDERVVPQLERVLGAAAGVPGLTLWVSGSPSPQVVGRGEDNAV